MTVKDSSNIFNWLSAIFICAILILGFLIFKGRPGNQIDISSEKKEISNPVDVKTVPLPGFLPDQEDDSLKISFLPPTDMVEDKESAIKNGIYKMFKPADSKHVHPESVITVSFCRKKDFISDLRSFILKFTKDLKGVFLGQKVDIVLLHLPTDVTKKFEDMSIPYQGIMFLIDERGNKPGYNCAIFFFETPAGYWSINWVAPRKILKNGGEERDIFLSLIKFMIIEIRRPDGTIEVHM